MSFTTVTIMDGAIPSTVTVHSGTTLKDLKNELNIPGNLRPVSGDDCVGNTITSKMILQVVRSLVTSARKPTETESTAMNKAVEAAHINGIPELNVTVATTADNTSVAFTGRVNGIDGIEKVLGAVSVPHADHASTLFIRRYWRIFNPDTNASILAGLGTAPLNHVTNALNGLTMSTTKPFFLDASEVGDGNVLIIGTPGDGEHTHLSTSATVPFGLNWATREQTRDIKTLFASGDFAVNFRTTTSPLLRSNVNWTALADKCTSDVLQPCLDWFASFWETFTAAKAAKNSTYARNLAYFIGMVTSLRYMRISPTIQNMRDAGKFTYQPELWRDFRKAVLPLFSSTANFAGDRTTKIANTLNNRAAIPGYREKTPVLVARPTGSNKTAIPGTATTVILRVTNGDNTDNTTCVVKTGYYIEDQAPVTPHKSERVFTITASNGNLRNLQFDGKNKYDPLTSTLLVNLPNHRTIMIPAGPAQRLGLPEKREMKIAAAAVATGMNTWYFYVETLKGAVDKLSGSFLIPSANTTTLQIGGGGGAKNNGFLGRLLMHASDATVAKCAGGSDEWTLTITSVDNKIVPSTFFTPHSATPAPGVATGNITISQLQQLVAAHPTLSIQIAASKAMSGTVVTGNVDEFFNSSTLVSLTEGSPLKTFKIPSNTAGRTWLPLSGVIVTHNRVVFALENCVPRRKNFYASVTSHDVKSAYRRVLADTGAVSSFFSNTPVWTAAASDARVGREFVSGHCEALACGYGARTGAKLDNWLDGATFVVRITDGTRVATANVLPH